MAAVLTPFRRVWDFMSPAKPAAPQAAKAATTPNTKAPSLPIEQDLEQDLEQSTPRSLFSDKPSDYMPGSKRKFELDFESPKTVKKAKMEALARSKRKREFEFETPQKKNKSSDMSQTMPPMPRSAMKPRFQPRTPATAMKKSVTFHRQPLTDTKTVRPMFGKAGNYAGSVFADASPLPLLIPESMANTPSTVSDIGSSQLEMSPTTKSNTEGNTPVTRSVFCHDPYDPYWRPQPHNPRPGQFCLPDDLSQYDDEEDQSIIEQSTPTQSNASGAGNRPTTPDSIRRGYSAVFPDSPETPRISHAQLPATASQSMPASSSTYPTPPQFSSSNPPVAGNIFAEAGADAVNKARAAAEKYKPESVGKQASKLSQVTQARSRSSSPPGSRPATPAFALDPALVAQDKKNVGPAQQVKSDATSNMVTHELEQHLDKWAQNLEWPQPGQKIMEEEIFKSDMMDHILNDWTKEDDEQSEMFWDKEFDRVVEAGRQAERGGKTIMFI